MLTLKQIVIICRTKKWQSKTFCLIDGKRNNMISTISKQSKFFKSAFHIGRDSIKPCMCVDSDVLAINPYSQKQMCYMRTRYNSFISQLGPT